VSFREAQEVRAVTGLSNEDLERCRIFLQGAVYCWCKNRKDEWFAARDLVGGENNEWDNIPLDAVYQKHIANLAPERAYTEAARDVGWILKGVIADDQRVFNTRIAEEVRHYQWVP
jgi:hypothetical protein